MYTVKIENEKIIIKIEDYHTNGSFEFPYDEDLYQILKCDNIDIFSHDYTEKDLEFYNNLIGDNFITGGDLVYVANMIALREICNNEGIGYTESGLGYNETMFFNISELLEKPEHLKILREVFDSLENYPLINDDIYSEIENEQMEIAESELVTEVLEHIESTFTIDLSDSEKSELTEMIFTDDLREDLYNSRYSECCLVGFSGIDKESITKDKEKEIKSFIRSLMKVKARKIEIYLGPYFYSEEVLNGARARLNASEHINKVTAKKAVMKSIQDLARAGNVKPADLQHFADLMGNKKMYRVVMSEENKNKPVSERIEIAKQFILNYEID